MTLVAPVSAPDHVPAEWAAPVPPGAEQAPAAQPSCCTRCGDLLPAHDVADPTAVRGWSLRAAGTDLLVTLCASCYLGD